MRRAWQMTVCSMMLLTLAVCVAAHASEFQNPPAATRPEIVKPMEWVGIVPPEPISRDDLDRYGKMLDLSAAQQQVYQRLRDDYERFCVVFITDTMQPMWNRAGEVSRLKDAASFLARDGLSEDRAKALKELRSREATMFEALAAVLAEPQQLKLEIVRLDRQRALFDSSALILPEAQPDLVSLLLQLKIAFDAENAPLEKCVSDYIVEIAPALKSADDAGWRMFRKDNAILAEYVELQKRQEEGWQTRGEALLQSRADEHKKCLGECKTVRDINRRHLALLMAALSADDSARLRDAFREASYHAPLYPDAQSAAGAFAQARAIKTLSDVQREAIDNLEQQFNTSYDALARKLHESVDDWRTFSFTEPSVHNDVRAQFEKKTADLKADRIALNVRYRQMLIDLLTPEQAPAIKPMTKPR